jgi:hypothetical protein
MVIIEDDASNKEVPTEIVGAEYFNIIIQYHLPSYWEPSSSAANFLTINGITNNPILQIRQSKWLRLRILSTSLSLGTLVEGKWTIPNSAKCQVVLIAKDGVYLRYPRQLTGIVSLRYTESARNDVMVRCDGTVGSEIQIYFASLTAFRLKITSRNTGESPDTYDVNYQACLPSILDDTFNDNLVNAGSPLTFNPFVEFAGFTQDVALGTYPVGSTIQLALTTPGHPWHIHINHFQIQEDQSNGWYKRGDWHDSVENLDVRMRLSRYSQLMLFHCQ